MTDAPEETIDVRDAPEAGRFEIWVDDVCVGYTDYVDRPEGRVFPHTEIDEAYGGRGLATRLIRDALDATRGVERLVVPLCPVVSGFIRKNPEYAELVPAGRHAEFGL